MEKNSKEAKSVRAYRQGWGSDGFKEIEKKSSDRSLAGSVHNVGKPDETLRAMRGHDFYPDDLHEWPSLYATDGDGPLADKKFVAHYFTSSADWYVCEVDSNTLEAFGYADLGLGYGEFGYIDLNELETFNSFKFGTKGSFPAIVERDLGFVSGTQAKDVIEKYKPVTARQPSKIEDLDEHERRELDAVSKNAYDFAKRVDSPFPRESDRREFSTWCAQRYLSERATYTSNGYSLAVEWMAGQHN